MNIFEKIKKNIKNRNSVKIKYNKGFTLIELLVVIAIISVLSSVVFSTLSKAKNKAKDTAIKESLGQYERLVMLDSIDSPNGCNLIGDSNILYSGGLGDSACSNDITTNGYYSDQAQKICNNLKKFLPSEVGVGYYAGFLTANSDGDCSKYSLFAALNNGKYYCIGNSAKSEAGNYLNGDDPFSLNSPGCPILPP